MSHRPVPPFDGEHFAANMMGISVSCFLPLMNGSPRPVVLRRIDHSADMKERTGLWRSLSIRMIPGRSGPMPTAGTPEENQCLGHTGQDSRNVGSSPVLDFGNTRCA